MNESSTAKTVEHVPTAARVVSDVSVSEHMLGVADDAGGWGPLTSRRRSVSTLPQILGDKNGGIQSAFSKPIVLAVVTLGARIVSSTRDRLLPDLTAYG